MDILDMIFNDANISPDLKKILKKDVEYVSECCDGLPVQNSVIEQNSLTGYCAECGMSSGFKKSEEKEDDKRK